MLLTDEEMLEDVVKWQKEHGGEMIDFDSHNMLQRKAQLKKGVEWLEQEILDSESKLSDNVKDKALLRELSLKNDIVIAQMELKGSIIGFKELRQALLEEVK